MTEKRTEKGEAKLDTLKDELAKIPSVFHERSEGWSKPSEVDFKAASLPTRILLIFGGKSLDRNQPHEKLQKGRCQNWLDFGLAFGRTVDWKRFVSSPCFCWVCITFAQILTVNLSLAARERKPFPFASQRGGFTLDFACLFLPSDLTERQEGQAVEWSVFSQNQERERASYFARSSQLGRYAAHFPATKKAAWFLLSLRWSKSQRKGSHVGLSVTNWCVHFSRRQETSTWRKCQQSPRSSRLWFSFPENALRFHTNRKEKQHQKQAQLPHISLPKYCQNWTKPEPGERKPQWNLTKKRITKVNEIKAGQSEMWRKGWLQKEKDTHLASPWKRKIHTWPQNWERQETSKSKVAALSAKSFSLL